MEGRAQKKLRRAQEHHWNLRNGHPAKRRKVAQTDLQLPVPSVILPVEPVGLGDATILDNAPTLWGGEAMKEYEEATTEELPEEARIEDFKSPEAEKSTTTECKSFDAMEPIALPSGRPESPILVRSLSESSSETTEPIEPSLQSTAKSPTPERSSSSDTTDRLDLPQMNEEAIPVKDLIPWATRAKKSKNISRSNKCDTPAPPFFPVPIPSKQLRSIQKTWTDSLMTWGKEDMPSLQEYLTTGILPKNFDSLTNAEDIMEIQIKLGLKDDRSYSFYRAKRSFVSCGGIFIDEKFIENTMSNALILNNEQNYVILSENDEIICIIINDERAHNIFDKFVPSLVTILPQLASCSERGNSLLRGFNGEMFCHGLTQNYSDTPIGPYATGGIPKDTERLLRDYVLALWNIGVEVGCFDEVEEEEATNEIWSYPGTPAEKLFISKNASLAQHWDNDEPLLTIGLWGDLKRTSIEGGKFIFSQRNLIIPFNSKGTIMIWGAGQEEHGTSKIKMNTRSCRFGSAVTHKGKMESMRRNYVK